MPSTGERNNNYLNLKNGPSPWLDADGKDSRTDERGHAVFRNPAYGVRAGLLQLRIYYFTHQLRTIAQILARWAPSSDTVGSLPGAPQNSPKEYSTFVAGRMGISFNQQLDLFDKDKTIANLAELRELFFAMAAVEIGGGFKVPSDVFAEGVELFEPGITQQGTDQDAEAEPTAEQALDMARWSIKASVGRPNKGAVNKKEDVTTVQEMLRNTSLILGDARLDPGEVDGVISPVVTKSDTVRAIDAFQSRFMVMPDGLIEVNGRTWRELMAVLTGSRELPLLGTAENAGKFFFPFTNLPGENWTNAPRSFASRRDSGARAHAGCDLYFPAGTTIHAITDGTVVRGPYPFYAKTFALEIDHGTFIARYGEVQELTMVSQGDRVVAGQPIARVGHLVGIVVPSDMLHLELYDKSGSGPLTVGTSQSARTPGGVPFLRRKDLMDPTQKLNEWKTSLAPAASAKPAEPVAFVTANGAKIPARGFCIFVKRVRQEKRSSMNYARTISTYQCYFDGVEINALAGQMAERGGPGDNTSAIGSNRHLRISEGVYPLSIHAGVRYRTYGYADKLLDHPMPGLLLEDTDERSAILIHPCHDANGYVSSIGCINPVTGLTNANSKIDLTDSRNRVIAIIDGMKRALGAKFPKSGSIPGAVIIIEGEPG
jgi:murein DD-endopeptidase MepM/ murein hydrolase activator NlpD